MRTYLRLFALISYTLFGIKCLLVVVKAEDSWAFLAKQADCKLKCQNGGVCAFDTRNPERHKCICFIGLFRGDRCETSGEILAVINHAYAITCSYGNVKNRLRCTLAGQYVRNFHKEASY